MSLCYIFRQNVVSERVVVALKTVEVNWFHATHVLSNLIIDSIHAWLKKPRYVVRYAKEINACSCWFVSLCWKYTNFVVTVLIILVRYCRVKCL